MTPRGRDVVPVGTVASRVFELQKVATSSKSNRSRSPVTRRRENSRTGFGRRLEPRFGQPASRSSKPEEELHVDPKHSFLGLNTNRGNHMEEHALVDGRVKWDRTVGLHGQLQPSGLGARVQYEAKSPWGILPKGEPRRNPQREYNNQERGTLENSNTKSQPSNMAPISQLPNSSHDGTRRMSIKQEESSKPSPPKSRRHTAIDQRKAPTSCEWLSIETTSTMRQQSVKDLYYYYGIQRPAGLVSSENVALHLEETPRPLAKYIFCHVCSWASAPDTIKCRCGHSFCRECDSSSPEAITTSDENADCIDNVPKREGEHLEEDKYRSEFPDFEVPKPLYQEQQKPNPQVKRYSMQVDTPHQKTSKKHRSRSEEEPDGIPGTFPVMRLEESTPRYRSWETPPRNAELPNSSRVCQQTVIASEAQTSVGEPFSLPMADALISPRASDILPIAMRVNQVGTQDFHHSHHHRQEGCYNGSSHSKSSKDDRGSGNDSCDSSGCRATHRGYRPYRHSITCTRKRRRYPEETDSGYIAGASYLEELEVSQHKTDPNPRSGSGLHGHHMPSKQHLSQSQNESDSLQGNICVYKDGQSSHQKSYEEHEASFQGKVNRPEGIKRNQGQFYPKEHKELSSYKTAGSLLDNLQSYDPPEKENDHQSNLNTLDNSCECKQSINQYQIQGCGAGSRQAHSHVYNGHTQAFQDIAPGNATAVVGGLGSMPISPEPPPKTLSEPVSSYPVKQSVITIPAPKPHLEMKSPDLLTDDTVVPSRDRAGKEILIVQKYQFRPDGRKIWSGKTRQENSENPMHLPLQSSRDIHQPGPGHSNDIRTAAVPQDSQNAMTATPNTSIEDDHPKHRAGSHADPTPDTVQCLSIQASGDLSPRKFKPASRRLSAFFKLQEQNIVALLNKRLQEHQDELKRIERMSDDKLSVAVQKVCLDQEQDHDLNGQKNKVKQELTDSNSKENCEHRFSNPPLQMREQAEKAKGLGTACQEGTQDSSSKLALRNKVRELQEEKRDCTWKWIAIGVKNGIAQKQNLFKIGKTTKPREKEVSDIRISDITIIIHLEGREDVVIKADLSQGI